MTDRIEAASAFALAAITVWLGAAFLIGIEFAVFGGVVSVPVALLIGGSAGHRLAADARRTRVPHRGLFAGILVTVSSYVGSALALAVWLGAPGDSVFDVWSAFTFCLVFGLLFVTPGVLPGSIAGYLFYRRIIAEASDPTPPSS